MNLVGWPGGASARPVLLDAMPTRLALPCILWTPPMSHKCFYATRLFHLGIGHSLLLHGFQGLAQRLQEGVAQARDRHVLGR